MVGAVENVCGSLQVQVLSYPGPPLNAALCRPARTSNALRLPTVAAGEGPPTPPASRPQSPDTGELQRPRHRLQRQKAQSRKTFRFGKSRRGAGWAAAEGGAAGELDAPPPPTLAEEEPPERHPRPTRASSIHGLPPRTHLDQGGAPH